MKPPHTIAYGQPEPARYVVVPEVERVHHWVNYKYVLDHADSSLPNFGQPGETACSSPSLNPICGTLFPAIWTSGPNYRMMVAGARVVRKSASRSPVAAPRFAISTCG